MMGKLIVIEGVDGSGKETQSNLLFERLKKSNDNVTKITFPDYNSPSSSLVKMYLAGEFGQDADGVDPYPPSVFYAADRYASYKTKWEKEYLSGGIIIADRYMTSNLIHQSCKINDFSERERYFNWLIEFEYRIMKIPEPDIVFFLDMPPAYSAQLRVGRSNKITGGRTLDIHEKDPAFLQKSYDNANLVADKFKWIRISCVSGGKIRPIEEIHNEIYRITKPKLYQ